MYWSDHRYRHRHCIPGLGQLFSQDLNQLASWSLAPFFCAPTPKIFLSKAMANPSQPSFLNILPLPPTILTCTTSSSLIMSHILFIILEKKYKYWRFLGRSYFHMHTYTHTSHCYQKLSCRQLIIPVHFSSVSIPCFYELLQIHNFLLRKFLSFLLVFWFFSIKVGEILHT